MVQLLLERGDIDPDKVNRNNKTAIDVFESRDWNFEKDNKKKRDIQELFKFHALGLPVEIRTLDKDSAKVFTHLLEEESYPHFESRVILAGEQGTGKTTIARYLVGKGPTKVRKSTDGIGLYTGLSYIDRETEEWLEGKQDFSLEELTFSRSLRHKPLEIPTSSLSTGLPTDLSKRYTESLIAGASVQGNEQHIEFREKNEMQDITVEAERDNSRSREQGDWNNPTQGIEGGRPITNALLDVHNQQGDPNNERPVSNVHLRPVKIRDDPSDEIQVQNVHLDLQEHQDHPLDDNLIQNVPLVVDKTKCDIKEQRHVTCVQRPMPKVLQADVLQQRDSYKSRQMASNPVSSSKQPNYSDKDTQCEEFKDKTHFENPTENESQKYKLNPGLPLVLGGTKNSSFPEDLTIHAPIEQLKTLTELSEEEQATSGLTHSVESVTDPGIITKLKRFFGVSKEVKEIKVSITEKHILKQSLKVGKKKLHQKHIAPVIIWDFGGQDIFYSTHQSFLSYRAIYLIVLDGSRALDDPCQFEQYLPGKSGPKTARDYLGFWINTIVTYCKGSQHGFPKIMIVFTHKDKIKQSEVETTREQLYGDVKSMFQGTPLMSHLVIEDRIFVNARNKNDPEMTKIKTSIIRESKLQPTWGQNLPKCFIPLELEFENLIRKDINVITFDDLRHINTQHPIRPLTDAELKVFLKFQHAIGKILYFDEPGLDQHVILLPTYLIDAFKSIITDKRFCKGERQREALWDLMSQKGVISKFAIKELWRNRKYRMFKKRNDYLLAVMTHLDILVEPKRYDPNHNRIPADFYYVASMVQTKDDTGYLLSPSFSERNIGISFNSNDAIIPPALSFRFITYCLSIFDVKKYGETKDDMLFHRSAVFTIDPSLDIHILCEDERIFVRLVHARKKILIMKDLASSICECLKSAIQNISHLYIQTSSEKCDVNARSFQLNLCCSVVDDPCLLSIEEFNTIDESWICQKHKIEHEQFVLSRWITEKESEIHCELNCPVTHEAFLSEIPTALHLCRLSSLYNLDEIRELVTYLGLPYINWSDLYQFESEPEVLKFKVLRRCHDKSTLTFRQIKEAVEEGHIQTPHTLCKVMKGSSVDFETDPEKWDLVPTDKDIDKMAPLIGNKSLLYLIELGLDFCIWEDIHQRHCEMKNDLVKLNREILDKWLKFCKERNVRPTMRMIAQAYKNIGKDVKVIETTLSL
ncbi:uncharacterized protein [Mytilus edulis]|uniref:uncharacterized protein n=1 Tax=Mytilus edulis TaxID=6550 RepID=UPI0039EE60D0